MAQYSQNMERELAEVEAAIRASGASTFEEAEEKAKQELEELSHVTLNIAVTGGTGAGKSSFVNAIRGVADGDDEAAAPTDVVECTMTPTMYHHPTMPSINIWDLPGIGTEKFQTQKYIEDLDLNAYDFFLILTSTRLKEHDIMLAEEIRKNKKNFYFVRTKIDQDVKSQKRKGKTEEQTLSVIRQDLKEKLKDFPSAQIFLVSSWKLDKFDFHEMMCALAKYLPEKKQDALTLSLPVYSMEILDKKYKAFKRGIWAQAFASGAVGAVPMPGVSAAFDVTTILAFLTKVYYSFGLDEKSIKQLSDRVGKPIPADFEHSKLLEAIATKSVTALQVELTGFIVAEAIESALKVIPILGSLVGAGMSFWSTYLALKKGLDELYSISKKMLEMAKLK